MEGNAKDFWESVEEYPDFNRISTPGKTLTLGQLYEILDRTKEAGIVGEVAGALMAREEGVAGLAYRVALGGKLDGEARDHLEGQSRDMRQVEIDKLTKLYVELGLASGPHHAAELIKDIEAQAVAQVPDLPHL